ANCA
ncbi:Cos6p, partial [Saccharomyces cerevisiae YJM1463]